MNTVFVHGCGAVSPAGWGVAPLLEAVRTGRAVPPQPLPRPGWEEALMVRAVPAPAVRPDFLKHARLRRTSPITQFALAAALEAIGSDLEIHRVGRSRLGIIVCTMSGCVNYSRRFYDEVCHEPATASPLVFPETVFNAPASHLAGFFGSAVVDYTLVGDPCCFLQGAALAAHWLGAGLAEACVVVGAEEKDWLTADAFRLFSRRLVVSEGAGALYLKAERPVSLPVALDAITDAWPFQDRAGRFQAYRGLRSQLPPGTPGDVLCDGTQEVVWLDEPETRVWEDWPGERISPKRWVGEGLAAASAWQCVAAVDRLRQPPTQAATISVTGYNQHVVGARFVRAQT